MQMSLSCLQELLLSFKRRVSCSLGRWFLWWSFIYSHPVATVRSHLATFIDPSDFGCSLSSRVVQVPGAVTQAEVFPSVLQRNQTPNQKILVLTSLSPIDTSLSPIDTSPWAFSSRCCLCLPSLKDEVSLFLDELI